MNRIHDMPPGVIEDLDERYPVGVLGQDAGGWGYITMGPDRNPETVLNDGWGLLLPNYYYYMPPAFTTHATTCMMCTKFSRHARAYNNMNRSNMYK